jgi:hypothetical protein
MTASLRRVATVVVIVSMLAATALGVVLGVRPMLAREAAQARLLVDEGRQALLTNDRATAVLAFERARLFAPRSELVRSALAAADVQDADSIAPATLRYVTPPEWAALATGCGWIAGLGLAVMVARRRVGHAAPVVAISGTAFALGLTALFLASPGCAPVSVVVAGGTDALVAPYPGAAVSAPLPAGSVVALGATYGRFARVRSGDGHEGWVAAGSLEPVLPPP